MLTYLVYTLAIFWTARDVCADRAPVMYLSARIRHRWCTRGNVTTYITDLQNLAQYFGGAHNSWKTELFPIHNSFHNSPSPCRRTLPVFWTSRGVCDARPPVMYISASIRHRRCTRGSVTIYIADRENIAQYFGGTCDGQPDELQRHHC